MVMLSDCCYWEKREVCIAAELNSRPTIRVVSRLNSERTKPCPIANGKAWRHGRTGQTSFWNRLDLMIQNGGLEERNLLHKLNSPDIPNTMHMVDLTFVICYPVVIFI